MTDTNSSTRTRRSTAALVIGALLLMLTGCAAPAPEIDPSTVERLTAGVLAVSTDAAAGDPTAASAELDGVQAELDAAIADDAITAARATRIQTAIDLVRADLVEALTPVPPTEATTPEPTGDQPDNKGPGGKDKDCPPGQKKKGKDGCEG